MSETKYTADRPWAKNPLDFLYDSREEAAFGIHWCGPRKLKHGKDTLIAKYDKYPDGQSVEVYVCAMPARFYRLQVLAGTNSVGKAKPGFSIGTGSSQEELAASVAEAIAGGMLGFYPEEAKP